MKKKPSSFIIALHALLPMFLAVGIQLLVAFIVEIFLGFYFAFKNADLAQVAIANDDIQAYMDEIIVQYTIFIRDTAFTDVLTFLIMVSLLAVFAFWFFKAPYAKLMTPKKEALNARNVLFIIISGILAQLAVSILLTLILPLFPRISSQYGEIMDSLEGKNTIFSVVSVCLLAPFAEELIFRGVTLRTLKKYTGFGIANFIQALLFGIYHMNIVQGIYAFAIGLIFGYVAYKLNNIFASILFHAAVNSSSFVLAFLPEALFTNALVMLLIALISALTIWGLIYLLKYPVLPEIVTLTEDRLQSNMALAAGDAELSAFEPLQTSDVDFSAPVQTPEVIGEIEENTPENLNSQEENTAENSGSQEENKE